VLAGNGGADRLSGGAGADLLAGGQGQDTFVIDDPGGALDRIADFATGAEGDRLGFAAGVLDGFDPASSDLADFFDLQGQAGGTLLRVDGAGGGDDFVAVALLQGVSGVSVDNLVANADQTLSIVA